MTEKKFTHADLVEIAYKWVMKNGSCGVAFKELVCYANGEIPDVIGFGQGHSVLIECKISRSDFLADANKPFRITPSFGMGKHRYYCCPSGLISVDELPEGWGLIYVDEKGKAKKIHYPKRQHHEYKMVWHYEHARNIAAENALMYSALRRLQLRGRISEIYNNPFDNQTN